MKINPEQTEEWISDIKIVEVNVIQNRKISEKIKEAKSWFFGKSH